MVCMLYSLCHSNFGIRVIHWQWFSFHNIIFIILRVNQGFSLHNIIILHIFSVPLILNTVMYGILQ